MKAKTFDRKYDAAEKIIDQLDLRRPDVLART